MLKYEIDASVVAFSTKRAGGVGQGAYSSFNITHYCGDSAENVAANRALLCAELGIADERLILPLQTHGTEAVEIDGAFLALDAASRAQRLHSVDAIFTRERGVCIGVSTADCIPVLLYDEKSGAVAAIHAGWRGTVAGIVGKTMRIMKERYGTDFSSAKAVVAPGISLDSFEVGDEVYEAFREASFPMESIARRYGEKWHIDLPEANRLQLIAGGLSAENISLSGVCTFVSHDIFFSARRLGIKSGRIFNGIMIK